MDETTLSPHEKGNERDESTQGQHGVCVIDGKKHGFPIWQFRFFDNASTMLRGYLRMLSKTRQRQRTFLQLSIECRKVLRMPLGHC